MGPDDYGFDIDYAKMLAKKFEIEIATLPKAPPPIEIAGDSSYYKMYQNWGIKTVQAAQMVAIDTGMPVITATQQPPKQMTLSEIILSKVNKK